MSDQRYAEAVSSIPETGLIRYEVVPGDYEAGFRFAERGEWIRFEDVWPELQQLRKRVVMLETANQLNKETIAAMQSAK